MTETAILVERLVRKALDRARRGERVVSLDQNGYRIIIFKSGQPWKHRFLEWLSKGRSVRNAAALAGVTKTRAYESRQADPDFMAAWEEIKKC